MLRKRVRLINKIKSVCITSVCVWSCENESARFGVVCVDSKEKNGIKVGNVSRVLGFELELKMERLVTGKN